MIKSQSCCASRTTGHRTCDKLFFSGIITVFFPSPQSAVASFSGLSGRPRLLVGIVVAMIQAWLVNKQHTLLVSPFSWAVSADVAQSRGHCGDCSLPPSLSVSLDPDVSVNRGERPVKQVHSLMNPCDPKHFWFPVFLFVCVCVRKRYFLDRFLVNWHLCRTYSIK